jgi:hypothetical protein
MFDLQATPLHGIYAAEVPRCTFDDQLAKVYIFAEQIEQAFPVKAIVKPSVLSTRTF